jgi:hypothetical protein
MAGAPPAQAGTRSRRRRSFPQPQPERSQPMKGILAWMIGIPIPIIIILYLTHVF